MFETRYTNEYGDDWVFRYDPETATGTVEGSDVGWGKYPVLRGFATLSLELSSDEGMWLWRSWRRAVDRYGDPGIYGNGRATGQGPGEKLCPLCLEHKEMFEGHHCVWRSEKGTDHHKNILPICKSCHALLTHGDPEDSNRRDLAAYYHQAARYGAAFFFNAHPPRSEEHEAGRSVWSDSIKGKPRSTRLERGRMLKNYLESRYVYYRDTALERLPRFDLLTYKLRYERDPKRFERDRVEYMDKWEAV